MTHACRPGLLGLAAGLMVTSLAGCGNETNHELSRHADHPLGTVDFPVSCTEPARKEFNRAVALLHHMTYPQALEAFEHIAAADPRCAMAQWGIAMSLFQPLWPTRPGVEERRRGWEAVQKAHALELPTQRERLFMAAAEAFFLEPLESDYWLRIRRWEQVSEKLYAAFPDDPEASAFYALAHLATAPSNVVSRAHADRAAEILLRVYEQNPHHPGAMHYLIHANEAKVSDRRLDELEAATREVVEALFARNIRVLRLELDAWLAHLAGQDESSVALMRAAAELEASMPKHPVTPAPTLPAHEQLGDLLLEQNQPGQALAAYKRSIESYPGRFNSLLGAARAARALGDKSLA